MKHVVSALVLLFGFASVAGAQLPSEAVVQRVLSRERAALDACIAGTPSPMVLEVVLAVAADGTVTSAAVSEPAAVLPDERAHGCVQRALLSAHFPETTGEFELRFTLERRGSRLVLRRGPPVPPGVTS